MAISKPSGSLVEEKIESKRRGRVAANEKVEGISPKRFVCSLGARKLSLGHVVYLLDKIMSVTCIDRKGYKCKKGEVKLSTVKGWRSWGRPDTPNEGGKSYSESYLTLPSTLEAKLKAEFPNMPQLGTKN